MPAHLYLIGAGPGSLDTLTIGAYRLLHSADVLLIDRLVPSTLYASCTARMHIASKSMGNATAAQNELNAWGLLYLQQGLVVVRLKNGDPGVFARGGEERAFYKKAGYPVTLLPGLSSALAAGACGDFGLTQRGIANEILICTGQGQNGSWPDWPTYKRSRTVVFLMGVGRLGTMTKMLMAKKGFPKTISVAIVEKVSLPTQRKVVATLETIADLATRMQVQAPAVIIVGHIVQAWGNSQHMDDIGIAQLDMVVPSLLSSESKSYALKNRSEYGWMIFSLLLHLVLLLVWKGVLSWPLLTMYN